MMSKTPTIPLISLLLLLLMDSSNTFSLSRACADRLCLRVVHSDPDVDIDLVWSSAMAQSALLTSSASAAAALSSPDGRPALVLWESAVDLERHASTERWAWSQHR